MKAAMFLGPGRMEIQDVPKPVCKDKEVLVRMKSCAICGTDVRIFTHGQKNVVPPRITGHEIAGVVEQVGKKVKSQGYKPGDNVTVVTSIGCQKCRYCKDGYYNLCDDPRYLGYYYDGGFAEYMIVPEDAVRCGNIMKITKKELSYPEISIIEPLSCCINGQEYLNIKKGDSVVVFGAGPIGCMHAELAKAYGAKHVVMIDVSDKRLDMARRFKSITMFVNSGSVNPAEKMMELTEGHGVDVVITACSVNAVQEQAIQMIAKRGRISFFAGLPKDNPYIKFDSNVVHYKEVSVFGAFASFRKQYETALKLLSTGKVDAKQVIRHTYPLEKIVEALETAKSGVGLKVVVTMD
jgi:L-iditol 2-dehydrogenase